MSKKPLTEKLITDGMGYCCLYAYFSLYRQNRLIAARLGIHRWTVWYWKRKYDNGELTCQCNGKCMKDKLPELKQALKIIRSEAASSEDPSASPSPRRPY